MLSLVLSLGSCLNEPRKLRVVSCGNELKNGNEKMRLASVADEPQRGSLSVATGFNPWDYVDEILSAPQLIPIEGTLIGAQ